jgi:hypothetical protein
VTSPIFIFDAGIAEPNLVPAIQVTGRLTGCIPGTDNYGESTTVEQDGHLLGESGERAGLQPGAPSTTSRVTTADRA